MRALALFAFILLGQTPAVYAAGDLAPIVEADTATIPLELGVGLGSSAPADGGLLVDPKGPSRATGGEWIVITFREPKVLSEVRLEALSKSKAGKVLIRKAGHDGHDLPDLYVFNAAQHPADYNYQGLVMLADGAAVSTVPADPVRRLVITAEGFTNNDSTLIVRLRSAGGFAYEDFVVDRSGASASGPLGGFFDESDYRNFSRRDLRGLMKNARTPGLNELADTTWVCSGYYSENPQFDFKTRHYFKPAEGTLQSTTDLYATPVTWILTQSGWRVPNEMSSSCGKSPAMMNLRLTEGGNLILELGVDRAAFRRDCLSRGYTRESIERYLSESTFRPEVAPEKYSGYAHEFCRPARL